ncbi:hypothetical protein [Sphingopyxis sp.]|jgi:hypothetical protein|uniref:hypothetical protein n=1 Tax=Sphingopyxis sp. TaxID=1908224 RepID=UPI00311F3C30
MTEYPDTDGIAEAWMPTKQGLLRNINFSDQIKDGHRFCVSSWRVCLMSIALLVASGCGFADRDSSAKAGAENFGERTPLPNQEKEELRSNFSRLAPNGWVLQDFSESHADYAVVLPTVSRVTPISGNGSVWLDGRLEDAVKLNAFVARWTEDSEADRENARKKFPDYEGYQKDVSVESLGYNTKVKANIHSIEYFNKEIGISCYGHSHLEMRCYWGSKDRRWVLHFKYSELNFILPYVKIIAESQSGSKHRHTDSI